MAIQLNHHHAHHHIDRQNITRTVVWTIVEEKKCSLAWDMPPSTPGGDGAAGRRFPRPGPAHSGKLTEQIWVHRSANAAVVVACGFLGLGLVVFTAIWTNGDASLGSALGWTVTFGLLGVFLQALAGALLELLTPGRMRDVLVERELHPGSVVLGAAQLAVSVVVVASIW